MNRRPRRLRTSAAIRAMVQETSLSVQDFIFPLFVMEGKKIRSEISSMPGIFRFSLENLLEEIDECTQLGISGFALFPNLPESKKDRSEERRVGKEC